jgi:nucleotide-binding universal stress UspA family protein
MAKILCATRGGEASYKAQDAAISLALEQGAELVFIFVVDTAFLNKTERAFRLDTVTREMDHMGEFLLMMALERAKKRGAKASLLIRHGDFRSELIEVGRDPEITAIVLGEPVGEESSFSLEGVKTFRREIQEATGTEVILAGISRSSDSEI